MKVEEYELPRCLAGSYTQSPAVMLDVIRAARDGLATHPAMILGAHLGETCRYLFSYDLPKALKHLISCFSNAVVKHHDEGNL